MNDRAEALIRVSGLVQGVGYRNFAEGGARKLGLQGYCRNLPDGGVLLEVEGERAQIELFIQQIRQGPRLARVTEVTVDWKLYRGRFSDFVIRYS